MLNFQDYEKAVFDALIAKRETDRRFNFSVRQKASKGAEKNYFIGTENSKYFGTTFWYVSVSFPGSAGDLINLFFFYVGDNKLGYYYQFIQTTAPDNDQNQWALDLIKSIEPVLEEKVGIGTKSKAGQKIHKYMTRSRELSYSTVDEMMEDVFLDAEIIIPIVNRGIEEIKAKHPEFIAHPYTDAEFDKFQEKLQKRLGSSKASTPVTPPMEEKKISKGKFEPNSPLNQLLFGPPGTGKTYNTVNEALKILGEEIEGKTREEIKEAFDSKVKEGQIVFTTFHQSMSYEDFIEGIKPTKPLPGEKEVFYEVQKGVFYQLCEKAKSNYENSKSENKSKLSFEDAFEKFKEDWEENPEMKFPLKTQGYDFTITGFSSFSIQFKKASGGTSHTLSINTLKDLYYGREMDFKQGVGIYYPSVLQKVQSYSNQISKEVELQNFVLIIDEINRGNVSQIFGELITLIEEDKRLGRDEALEVTLPYSKEKFGVPSNLYIIGTMNTADRSVEALDTALRRRFCFTEMPPKYDLKELNYSFAGITGRDILETINRRIEKLLDRDHLIGHSYFLLKKDDESSLGEKLRDSFNRNIIPLLQEYFFGDYAKMGAVLGKGFVNVKNGNNKVSESIFAPFDDFEPSDYQDKPTFEIIHYPDVNSIVTVLIKDITEEFTFEKAIRILMNLPID